MRAGSIMKRTSMAKSLPVKHFEHVTRSVNLTPPLQILGNDKQHARPILLYLSYTLFHLMQLQIHLKRVHVDQKHFQLRFMSWTTKNSNMEQIRTFFADINLHRDLLISKFFFVQYAKKTFVLHLTTFFSSRHPPNPHKLTTFLTTFLTTVDPEKDDFWDVCSNVDEQREG